MSNNLNLWRVISPSPPSGKNTEGSFDLTDWDTKTFRTIVMVFSFFFLKLYLYELFFVICIFLTEVQPEAESRRKQSHPQKWVQWSVFHVLHHNHHRPACKHTNTTSGLFVQGFFLFAVMDLFWECTGEDKMTSSPSHFHWPNKLVTGTLSVIRFSNSNISNYISKSKYEG